MESAKSNSPKSEKQRKPREGRVHHNAKFYTSSAWRGLRKQYIKSLSLDQLTDIQLHTDKDIGYLISMIPICERCYSLYMADAYDVVNSGNELDHIKPLNPENALDTEQGRYGQPLDESNLQLLCYQHHFKKSMREKKKK